MVYIQSATAEIKREKQKEERNKKKETTTTTTPQLFYCLFFRDNPGELVLEENFWTLWCKGRLTEANTQTIQLGATPSGLTSDHLHHPPFFTG